MLGSTQQRVTSTDAATPAPQRTGARAWIALAILFFVYVLNFLDRQLLAILSKPIQDELKVTDGQLGMIGGLYFALFYCILAIPVGWLADRTNRVRVVSLACGLWSAATAACGMVSTYPQLVAARMAVGVGEAGGVPPSYAIISDLFPPGKRGTALGLYNVGPPIGQAMGVAFGASVAAAYSWRDAFLVVGIVGVFTALLLFLVVREPERGGLDPELASAARQQPARSSLRATCKMFFQRRDLTLMAFACAATQFVTYAMLNFTTLLLMREKGMSLEEVAVYYALVVGIAMTAGIFGAGRLLDHMVPKSRRAYALIPAVGLALALPFFIGFVWAPTWPVAIALLAPPMALNFFFLSPAVAFVQESVEPHQRVLSGALLLLVMNLVGLGLGPTFVGAASDWFKPAHPENSLQLAFYALVPFYFLAIGLFLLLARTLGRAGRS